MIKNILKYVALISLTFLPSIIVAEITLMLLPQASKFNRVGKASIEQYSFDKNTGYSLAKNIDDEILRVSTNKYGNRIVRNQYDPSKKSLLIVGDSTVFGWGVKNEDAFVYLISEDKRFSCFNIVNLGVPSYSLGNIKEVINEKVKLYNPSMIMIAILWPWKAFEDNFYGPNPQNDWKEINIDFFKENIPYRSGYNRSYKFGDNISYLVFKIAFDTKNKLISYKKNFLNKNKKNKINESRFVSRPGIRDFNLSKKDELIYAKDHTKELKKAENNFKLKNSELNTNFIYYLHPYSYTVDDPIYSRLGIIGYKFIQDELNALDIKSIIRKNYLKNKKIEDIYFDGSHLTIEGNQIWAEILGEKISQELKRNNLECNI